MFTSLVLHSLEFVLLIDCIYTKITKACSKQVIQPPLKIENEKCEILNICNEKLNRILGMNNE